MTLTRIDTEARPDGVVLEPSIGYFESLLKDLFVLLTERRELLEDLLDLLDGPPRASDPYFPESASRDDDLAERIAAALDPRSRQIRIYQAAVATLCAELSTAGSRVPSSERKVA